MFDNRSLFIQRKDTETQSYLESFATLRLRVLFFMPIELYSPDP